MRLPYILIWYRAICTHVYIVDVELSHASVIKFETIQCASLQTGEMFHQPNKESQHAHSAANLDYVPK